uniref:4Fe-4S dicluster domain-containing protein n=1 Tax=Desulfosarcina cetonica TaxID=90730 RepID=UPI00155D9A11
LACIDTCVYGARFLDEAEQRVHVDPNLCQGCGDCATVCPNSASIVGGFSPRGLMGSIEAAVASV